MFEIMTFASTVLDEFIFSVKYGLLYIEGGLENDQNSMFGLIKMFERITTL
jgi:hypothetical protein